MLSIIDGAEVAQAVAYQLSQSTGLTVDVGQVAAGALPWSSDPLAEVAVVQKSTAGAAHRGITGASTTSAQAAGKRRANAARSSGSAPVSRATYKQHQATRARKQSFVFFGRLLCKILRYMLRF